MSLSIALRRGDAGHDLERDASRLQCEGFLASAPEHQRVTTLQNRGIDVTLKTVNGVSHYNTTAFAKPLKTAMAWLRERW